jgi:hypothetical protein
MITLPGSITSSLTEYVSAMDAVEFHLAKLVS